jgi:hypothetical protein
MSQSFAILRFQNALAEREGRDLEETYRRVIDVLARVGARWSIVGAHAVNLYVEPRATVDIDLVVDARKMKPILEALEEEFGALQTTDIGAALRITNLSGDLIRGDNHPLFRAALDEAEEHAGVRVPPVELLLVLKFLAATSPWRDIADRKQDVADLIRLYRAAGAELDRQAAMRYASRVYPRAEVELERILERIDRGEDVSI